MIKRLLILIIVIYYCIMNFNVISVKDQHISTLDIYRSAISLKDLLEEASKQTGENLKVNPSIAHEQVIINISNIEKLIESLDLLPGYQWLLVKKEDNTDTLILAPDWGERNLWNEYLKQKKRYVAERKKTIEIERLQTYFDAYELSPKNLETFSYEDPWLVWALSHTNTRAIIYYLKNLSESQLLQVFRPSGITIPFNELPFELQVELACWLHEESEQTNWQQPYQRITLEEALLKDGTLRISSGPEGMSFGIYFPNAPSDIPSSSGISVRFIRPNGALIEDGIMTLRISQGMSVAKAKKLRQEEKSIEDSELEPPIHQFERNEPLNLRLKGNGEPAIKLKKVFTVDASYSTLVDMLSENDQEFIFHYFNKYDHEIEPAITFSRNTPVSQVLDQVSDTIGFNWFYIEDMIILSSNNLFADLSSQVPELILKDWRNRLHQRKGKFSINDLAEIADTLSIEQLTNLPGDLERAGGDIACLKMNHLRFYASLSLEQRKKAWQEEGLSFSMLDDEQVARFHQAAFDRREQQRPTFVQPKSFRVKPEKGAVVFIYDFFNSPAQTFPFGVPEAKDYALEEYIASNIKSDQDATIQSQPKHSYANKAAVDGGLALAEYCYVGYVTADEVNIAMLERNARLAQKYDYKINLATGEELESATLQEITPENLVFKLRDATVYLPITRRVSLNIPF